MSTGALDGLNVYLCIETAPNPSDDGDFTRVVNEMEVKVERKSKTNEYEMKKNGGQIVNRGGAKSTEIKCELAHDETDPAFEYLANNLGESVQWQIRVKEGSVEKVKYEGSGIPSEVSETYAASGLAGESITIMGGGDVIRHAIPRALTV